MSRTNTFIQWKGTDVCIDIYCPCGKHLHFDGDFLYSYKCGHCKKSYELGTNVSLTETKPRDLEPELTQDEMWD